MKLRKLLPITALSITAASIAPVSLTSCSNYSFINLLSDYNPSTKPIDAKQWDSISDVVQYYLTLSSDIMVQDYIWSLSQYVKEKMEFPEPIFPFKFKSITLANVTVEQWFSQKHSDESRSDIFDTTFSIVFQLAGTTEPRKTNGSVGEYIDNSDLVASIKTQVTKFPLTIRNKYVSNSSNKTDETWIIEPAPSDVLLNYDGWNVSSSATLTYELYESSQVVQATIDSLSVYWDKTKWYDPIEDPKKSYLYEIIYDSLVYGSYHLKNCTLKA